MTNAQESPWEQLPREADAALSPHLPALAAEIVAAIAAEVPDYAGPLAGGSSAVGHGVQDALAEFVALSRGAPVQRGTVAADLGRRELRAGRSLDALLSAYRVGARVAWRRLAALGLAAGLAPETLVILAESIFAYIDELSAESAAGFAREQAERAGELERRRRVLAELLVNTRAPDPAAVAAAADAAHWRLPARVTVAVWREGLAGAGGAGSPPAVGSPGRAVAGSPSAAVAGPPPAVGSPGRAVAGAPSALGSPGRAVAGSPSAAPSPPLLAADTLRATVEGLACAVVPAARPAAALRRALGARAAGIGPAVGWPEAARSFRLACAALALADERGIGAPLAADEHRVALLFRAEPALVAELAAERLSGLAGETPNSRARLEATLLAWLRRDGSIAATAHDLGIHAQTVRYRLARLRELLGPALDEPDARFELELVLRAR